MSKNINYLDEKQLLADILAELKKLNDKIQQFLETRNSWKLEKGAYNFAHRFPSEKQQRIKCADGGTSSAPGGRAHAADERKTE